MFHKQGLSESIPKHDHHKCNKFARLFRELQKSEQELYCAACTKHSDFVDAISSFLQLRQVSGTAKVIATQQSVSAARTLPSRKKCKRSGSQSPSPGDDTDQADGMDDKDRNMVRNKSPDTKNGYDDSERSDIMAEKAIQVAREIAQGAPDILLAVRHFEKNNAPHPFESTAAPSKRSCTYRTRSAYQSEIAEDMEQDDGHTSQLPVVSKQDEWLEGGHSTCIMDRTENYVPDDSISDTMAGTIESTMNPAREGSLAPTAGNDLQTSTDYDGIPSILSDTLESRSLFSQQGIDNDSSTDNSWDTRSITPQTLSSELDMKGCKYDSFLKCVSKTPGTLRCKSAGDIGQFNNHSQHCLTDLMPWTKETSEGEHDPSVTNVHPGLTAVHQSRPFPSTPQASPDMELSWLPSGGSEESDLETHCTAWLTNGMEDGYGGSWKSIRPRTDFRCSDWPRPDNESNSNVGYHNLLTLYSNQAPGDITGGPGDELNVAQRTCDSTPQSNSKEHLSQFDWQPYLDPWSLRRQLLKRPDMASAEDMNENAALVELKANAQLKSHAMDIARDQCSRAASVRSGTNVHVETTSHTLKYPAGVFKKVPFDAPFVDHVSAALRTLLKFVQHGHGLNASERNTMFIAIRRRLNPTSPTVNDGWTMEIWASYLAKSKSGVKKSTLDQFLCLIGFHQSFQQQDDKGGKFELQFDSEFLTLSSIERKKLKHKLAKQNSWGEKLLKLVEAYGMGILLSPYIWDILRGPRSLYKRFIDDIKLANPGIIVLLRLLEAQVEAIQCYSQACYEDFWKSIEPNFGIDVSQQLSSQFAPDKVLQVPEGILTDTVNKLVSHYKARLQTVTTSELGTTEDLDPGFKYNEAYFQLKDLNYLHNNRKFSNFLILAAMKLAKTDGVEVGPSVEVQQLRNQTKISCFKNWINTVKTYRSEPEDSPRVYLCPIWYKGHFSLLEINDSLKKIFLYDSIGRNNLTCDPVFKRVKMDFKDMASCGFEIVKMPCPQQSDDSSCGPLVVWMAMQRMKGQGVGGWDDPVIPARVRLEILELFDKCKDVAEIDL